MHLEVDNVIVEKTGGPKYIVIKVDGENVKAYNEFGRGDNATCEHRSFHVDEVERCLDWEDDPNAPDRGQNPHVDSFVKSVAAQKGIDEQSVFDACRLAVDHDPLYRKALGRLSEQDRETLARLRGKLNRHYAAFLNGGFTNSADFDIVVKVGK